MASHIQLLQTTHEKSDTLNSKHENKVKIL